jgi:hypothetical protein
VGGEAVHSKYEVKSIGKGNVLQSAVLCRVTKCSRGSRATRPIMGYVAQASLSPRALTKSSPTPKEDICSRQFESPSLGHSYLLTAGNILLPFRRLARIGASGQQSSSRVNVRCRIPLWHCTCRISKSGAERSEAPPRGTPLPFRTCLTI